MISKLSSYIGEAGINKDNLDFLSAVKTEVEALIKSVDKFTMQLTQDPSFSTKPKKIIAKRKTSKHAGKKLKTEGSEQQSFQADTFNSKFKRHVQHTEKILLDSATKSSKKPAHSRRQTEARESSEISRTAKCKSNNKPEFCIERSTIVNKSWDSVKHDDTGSCNKNCTDLRSEIKSMKREQENQAILIQNLQLEVARMKEQNSMLIHHLGINEKVFKQ
jgi:hypothetical protein